MDNQKVNQVAEIMLTYKPQIRPTDRPKIDKAKDAYHVFLSAWDEGKIGFIEEFKVMLLNRNSKVLGIYSVSSGGISGCYVDTKLVFAAALIGCASGIILAHNHPSGSLNPSVQDLQLTKRIVEAGRVLDIKVIDHVIVTVDEYYSFADEGVL